MNPESLDLPLTLALDDETIGAIVFISVIGCAVIVCSIAGAIRRILTTRERETTTRDLAAYIAEGSITPEVAERLINARAKADLRDELSRKAADGWVSAKTVEKLLRDEVPPAALRNS